MVDTGHQSVVLAFCILTVIHIYSEKIICSLFYFCPQLDLLEVFPLLLHTAFLHRTLDSGFFCKIFVTFLCSITHTLKSLADEHPFVSQIHFTGTGGQLYIWLCVFSLAQIAAVVAQQLCQLGSIQKPNLFFWSPKTWYMHLPVDTKVFMLLRHKPKIYAMYVHWLLYIVLLWVMTRF